AHFASYPKIGKVLEVVFRGHAEQEFSLRNLEEHLRNLLITDQDMKTLAVMPWVQRETSKTLPRLFREVGALAIRAKSNLLLPYEEYYGEYSLDSATIVGLTPCLIPAVSI